MPAPRPTKGRDSPHEVLDVAGVDGGLVGGMLQNPLAVLSELEIEILDRIRAAYDAHAIDCGCLAKAILLNPGNHRLVGWDEAFGLPVLPDEGIEPMRFRLVCGSGRGGYCAQGEVYWDDDGDPCVWDGAPEPAS